MLSDRSRTEALGGASLDDPSELAPADAGPAAARAAAISSTSSSSLETVSKNDVGPSCFGSPTTTSCAPRAMAPSASSGRICDASSMTTRSKWNSPGGRYCATAGAPEHLPDGDVPPALLDLVLDQALLRELRHGAVADTAHPRRRVRAPGDDLPGERDVALVELGELGAPGLVDAAGEPVELRTFAQHRLRERAREKVVVHRRQLLARDHPRLEQLARDRDRTGQDSHSRAQPRGVARECAGTVDGALEARDPQRERRALRPLAVPRSGIDAGRHYEPQLRHLRVLDGARNLGDVLQQRVHPRPRLAARQPLHERAREAALVELREVLERAAHESQSVLALRLAMVGNGDAQGAERFRMALLHRGVARPRVLQRFQAPRQRRDGDVVRGLRARGHAQDAEGDVAPAVELILHRVERERLPEHDVAG